MSLWKKISLGVVIVILLLLGSVAFLDVYKRQDCGTAQA